ncbi:MAG: two-component regulator propeller domain-containing protein [Anaerolineales bacterium]
MHHTYWGKIKHPPPHPFRLPRENVLASLAKYGSGNRVTSHTPPQKPLCRGVMKDFSGRIKLKTQLIRWVYNRSMFSKQTRLIGQTIWILLLLLQASCGVMQTPQAAVEADAPATSRPPIVNRVVDESLPEICNCILRFDMIGIEEGLSQSSVHTIFQDSRGFLWFGTEDGLNRYDGYTFKVYKHDPYNEASISDGWINAIAEDQNGYLWIDFGTRPSSQSLRPALHR